MSEESTLWQVALLDRGESLVVMGRKKYDELYALAQNLTKERDAARALLQSVALVCRGAKEPDQADLSVLGNVLRERDEARAEVERLREAARLVHALALEMIVGDEIGTTWRLMRLRQITKGMVE